MDNTMTADYSFRKLRVWQESKKFAVEIITAISESKRFWLVDQITRSSVSIASNIAEGFERKWQAEFVQFLYIAKGSCAECITQIEICLDIGILETEEAKKFIQQAEEIKHMLMGLIAHEKTSSKRK